jgi:hypothetical protein
MYSSSYSNVGVVSIDANDLSWEIQGLYGYSDGAPAAAGATTTMVLRFINQQGKELDRLVFSRTAGGTSPAAPPVTTLPG